MVVSIQYGVIWKDRVVNPVLAAEIETLFPLCF